MRFFVAIFAVAILMLAAAAPSFAQKGGYGGYGYGHGGYGYGGGRGHHQGGYGAYGGYGCGYPCCPPNWHQQVHALRHYQNFAAPALPPPPYNAGPPTAAVTYPYYTVRGPRDFLLNNPPSIGP